MGKVKILNGIYVDVSENVEMAIYNLTGHKVEFELIKRFIINEKNTMFFIDRKLNSTTERGYNSDYLWLDTGFRDDNNLPIMICLHHEYDGYIGHYTGTIKELAGRVKNFNKNNSKDVDKNYSRFINKYKNKASERKTSCISNTREYAIAVANRDSVDSQNTVMALALQASGFRMEEIEELNIEPDENTENNVSGEELSEEQNEITIGMLVEQMEKMQKYIDELLNRIESNEKSSSEEITRLKAQNQEYKTALINIRMFNSENETSKELSETEKMLGHNLLGKNEKILVLGNADVRVAEMRAIARDYGFEKTDFEFITDYDKVKSAGARVHESDRFVAIIFGNCPHKVAGMGRTSSIIDEYMKRDDCTISVDARTEAGGLKITKQSFRNALLRVYNELKNGKAA